jgi:hypothetical protein
MKPLVLLLVVGLVGCQSVMKLDPDGNVIELKGGKAMRAYVALMQAKEREERYKAYREMATVKASTAAGEATRAMLVQTMLFQDGATVEAAAFHKAEAANNAKPWDFAKTALWAIPAWYLAFNAGGGYAGGDSYDSEIHVGGDLNASTSRSMAQGGEGGGGSLMQQISIGGFGQGAWGEGVTNPMFNWSGAAAQSQASGFANAGSEEKVNSVRDGSTLSDDDGGNQTGLF